MFKTHQHVASQTWDQTPGGLRGRFVHLQVLQPFGIRLSNHQLGESSSIHTTLLGREVRHNSLWKKHISYIHIYHLESRWRNSHVLVYHGPLLSHLLGVAPSTFNMVYMSNGKKTLPGQRGWKSPVIDEFRMYLFFVGRFFVSMNITGGWFQPTPWKNMIVKLGIISPKMGLKPPRRHHFESSIDDAKLGLYQ